ncbi:WapI family immunity protein [Dactylosporangium sp. CA-139066]|uniref:WapI family immunity protein n=1 Tax=Dactylosporangium sp. CA-139066 TaxID=3239930 RepID=UPI003D91D63B
MLHSSDGASLALGLAAYQFPGRPASGPPGTDWDANWLIVGGAVRTAAGDTWTFRDPCLTTSEARSLARWLHAASAGPVEDELLHFTEPNVAWSQESYTPARVVIRVHFSLESRPHFAAGDIFDFYVPFTLSPAHLSAAAEVWDGECAAFPVR